MTPFVKAMEAALENRLAAKTLLERCEAEAFLTAILRADSRGEDVSQFIPKLDFDARMAAAGKDAE